MSLAGFDDALEEIVEAAHAAFSDVQGELRSTVGAIERYAVSVALPGFTPCTLRIPSSGRSAVSCTSRGVRFESLAAKISAALDTQATDRTSTTTRWEVDGVVITLTRGGIGVGSHVLRIQEPR